MLVGCLALPHPQNKAHSHVHCAAAPVGTRSQGGECRPLTGPSESVKVVQRDCTEALSKDEGAAVGAEVHPTRRRADTNAPGTGSGSASGAGTPALRSLNRSSWCCRGGHRLLFQSIQALPAQRCQRRGAGTSEQAPHPPPVPSPGSETQACPLAEEWHLSLGRQRTGEVTALTQGGMGAQVMGTGH